MKLTKEKLQQIIKEELDKISDTGHGGKKGSSRFDVHDTVTGLGRLSTDADKLDPQFQAVFDALSPEAQKIAVFDDDNNFNDIVITNPTGAWRLAKINFRDGKYYLDSPIEKGHMRWSEKEVVDAAQVAQMIEEIL